MFRQADGRTLSLPRGYVGEKSAKMGFFLGKFIYLMDAYEDLPEDLKKDRYNPLQQDLRGAGL